MQHIAPSEWIVTEQDGAHRAIRGGERRRSGRKVGVVCERGTGLRGAAAHRSECSARYQRECRCEQPRSSHGADGGTRGRCARWLAERAHERVRGRACQTSPFWARTLELVSCWAHVAHTDNTSRYSSVRTRQVCRCTGAPHVHVEIYRGWRRAMLLPLTATKAARGVSAGPSKRQTRRKGWPFVEMCRLRSWLR